MFKIDPNPTFKRRVKLRVPSDDGFAERSIEVTFKALTLSRLLEFDDTTLAGMQALLTTVVSHVGDIQGADGTTLTFDDEVKRALLDIPFVRNAMAASYKNALAGFAEKN